MQDIAHRFLTADPAVLAREALRLAGLCAAIVVLFCLPALA